ncbi:related to DEF1-coordinates repair and RNA pol II proteolysis in response to DNA damage [Fusarium fujikuroi]|nr:related to DEF1-coordinates repair and RNA pol II proteolysis in response to DNA damage [Fusarium fujikuroi]SCN85871.1 related to DEF1-coordinates repair and RNA pol II proteolysis in response to DNA damage [Fusarium fujikuroi]SCO31676.1 related to DEF1-coordinates repair and RNA pol II proteolysis in response to DNA damage [Fusarium fujikuroi]
MASWPFSFVPAWLIFCVTVVLATNISNDFSSLIPSCAGECFASFLNVNYAQNVCTGKPLLDCLCSRRGASGFTLGEGAMQCISAERSIGYCSIVEASDRVIENAYDICNGRPGAVHPTYLTITATLVLAPTGGVVTFPSVTTKTTSRPDTSSAISTLPTTLVIDTSSPPIIPRPSTKPVGSTTRSTAREHSTTDSSDDSDIISITEPPFPKPTTFETSTYTSTSSSESETTTGVQGGAGGASKDEDSDDSDKLSTEQVAGISVGVLAAVGVAVGAIVLARYHRRRKYPQIKTGFLPMRDTWGYKPDRSDNGGHNSWMVHQLRPDLNPPNHPPPPPTSNRRSVKPEAIGVALSPPPSSRNTAVHTSPLRRLSKLLPAKPTLPDISAGDTVDKPLPILHAEQADGRRPDDGHSSRDESSSIPPPPPPTLDAAAWTGRSKPTPPAPLKLQIPQAEKPAGPAVRMSNRESNVTEFEEDRTSISPNASTQVWRPPTTPLSATTYYVADQYGNWVLGNPKRASVIARGSQESKVSQEGALRPPNNDNAPLSRTERSGTRSLAPPAEIIPGGAPSRHGLPRPQYPSPFFSSQSHPRRSASNRRSMTRPLTRPREDSSSSSATIITTSTESSSIPSVAPEQQVSLSPVVESPQSVRARQQQPQIPPRDPRRASQMGNSGVSVNSRAAPPTRQVVYSPPGQPSPTLGLMQPPSAYYVALQSKAQLNAQPQQKPQPAVQGLQPTDNTGIQAASSTMRIVEPSPEPDETTEPASVKEDQIRVSPFYFDPPYPQPLQSRQTSQHRRSASGPQPQQYQPYQRPPSFQPSPHQQQAAWQPVQRLHPHNHPQQRYNQQQQQQQQQNPWQPTQRTPTAYPSFQQQQQQQQQQPLQSYQRTFPHQQPYQQPQMYPSFHPRPSHQPYPHNTGGYQSFQPYPAGQQAQMHSAQYQSYRPPQSMKPSLVHSDSQDSLLAKRVGLDRAAGMTIGTDKTGVSKWNRDIQDKTPPNLPMSPHWQPTLTPTRRGDDLVLNVQ